MYLAKIFFNLLMNKEYYHKLVYIVTYNEQKMVQHK